VHLAAGRGECGRGAVKQLAVVAHRALEAGNSRVSSPSSIGAAVIPAAVPRGRCG
jgi:hypothetical protein